MSDDVTRLELGVDDAALNRALRDLGPLMRDQELLDSQPPDAAFARGLRARIVDAADVASGAPDPAFARDLRERLVGDAPEPTAAPPTAENDAPAPVTAAIPVDRSRRRPPPIAWAGLAAALVAALAAVALWLPHALPSTESRHSAPSVALGRAPQPSLGDITRGFQSAPGTGGGGAGGGGTISPVRGSIQLPSSPQPFYGPLTITAAALPPAPSTLPGYRLGAPLDRAGVERTARRVGIAARVTRLAGQKAFWNVAADGSGAPVTKHPLHSLAVSTITGETIYYDRRYQDATTAGSRPLSRSGAIAAARAWLASFGWSGMGVRSAMSVAGPNEWSVEVGWPGAGAATTPGATVLVVPGGHVVEAHLWPRVATRLTIHARRGVRNALTALQANRVPLSVTEDNGLNIASAGGRGTVTRVEVVEVLTADVDGKLYLVPAYRFSGVARLVAARGQGAPRHPAPIAATWYALVPATGNQ